MNGSAAPRALTFVDSLDFIVADCRSGEPSRKSACIVSTFLGAFTGLALPIFIASGLVGNALIVYINLFKQSEWTRQNVYISMIAMADNCTIFMNGFMWMFLAKGLPWLSNGTAGFIHLNHSSLTCSIVRYLEYVCHLTSAALFLLMVSDRTLSLYLPFRMREVTGKSAMMTSLAVIAACMLITLPVGYLYRWDYGDDGSSVVCYVPQGLLNGWPSKAFLYYNILLYYPPLLPLALIFVENVLLIFKVKRTIANRRSLTEGSSTVDRQSIVNTVVCVTMSAVLLISNLPVVVACSIGLILLELNPQIAAENGLVVYWGVVDIGVSLISA